MEQKQLDEMEESFSGEEFIDDADLLDNEVKVEPASPPKVKRSRKSAEKTEPEETADPEVVIIEENKTDEADTMNIEEEKTKDSEDFLAPVEEPKVEVKPQEEFKSKGTSPPIDPWADKEGKDSGFFKEVSTWKTITGIAVILLIFSIFNNGLGFSDDNITGAITLAEAEVSALDYVNTNLLQPPFLAESIGVEEVDNLYQVTLLVAGQTVDSYITKDGKLFFPQGFDTTLSLEDQLALAEDIPTDDDLAEVQAQVEDIIVSVEDDFVVNPEDIIGGEDSENVIEVIDLGEHAKIVVEEVVDEPASADPQPPTPESVEEPLASEAKEFTVKYWKWTFWPKEIVVNQGDQVTIFLAPDEAKSNLALNSFTFSLPGFSVEEEVSGIVTVDFVADQPGEFEFSCSSCEDWRGMTGKLVVE